MTLPPFALTTVADVEDELGVEPGSETTRLERYIIQASRMIASYLGRKLEREDDIVERHAGDGDQFLVLRRAPIVSVASVKLDDTEIDPDSYEVHDAEAGLLYRRHGWRFTGSIRRGVDQGPDIGTEELRYVVTYSAGWVTPAQAALGGELAGETVTLPEDIAGAALALVGYLRARRGIDRANYPRPGASDALFKHGVPPDVAAMLSPYLFLVQA